ncbi:MAG TPA: hypothetical protein VFA85_05300 [Terriglobales bacterium]|nr:hypothetical protein [Terriglobales bacterium]
MPVDESKAARRSPVFERLNLDRLKKSSQNLTRAEELIRRAETQLEQSQKIIDKSANRLSGIGPAEKTQRSTVRPEAPRFTGLLATSTVKATSGSAKRQ